MNASAWPLLSGLQAGVVNLEGADSDNTPVREATGRGPRGYSTRIVVGPICCLRLRRPLSPTASASALPRRFGGEDRQPRGNLLASATRALDHCLGSLRDGQRHLEAFLTFLALNPVQLTPSSPLPPSPARSAYLSPRPCGPRNLMKIALRYDRRGRERQGRALTGAVKAVYLSDPERACWANKWASLTPLGDSL
jgi:hypothetical protein